MKFEFSHDDVTGSGQWNEFQIAEDDDPPAASEETEPVTPDDIAQMIADETERMNQCLDMVTALIAKQSFEARNRQAPPPANFRPAKFRANRP